MWTGQRDLLPGRTCAPDLYPFGDDLSDWAVGALSMTNSDRIVVVGCSVGGSCALEIARLAPHRVAALVLVGTKAAHRPDPQQYMSAIEMLHDGRLEIAWEAYWEPLFSSETPRSVVAAAKRNALRRPSSDIARGVTAFHTRQSRTDTLAAFTGPVIVVSGGDDPAPGIETSKQQVAQARSGTLRVIPGCGHYVPLENPDALNAILSDVLVSVADGAR